MLIVPKNGPVVPDFAVAAQICYNGSAESVIAFFHFIFFLTDLRGAFASEVGTFYTAAAGTSIGGRRG